MPGASQTSPSTAVRTALKTMLETEFAAEGMQVHAGKLHPAMGEHSPLAGISPFTEAPGARTLDQETVVLIQVYDRWTRRTAPAAPVDPANIELFAERFRERLQELTHPSVGTRAVWFFKLLRIEYEEDPVGQVTRFRAYVMAYGENFAETSA